MLLSLTCQTEKNLLMSYSFVTNSILQELLQYIYKRRNLVITGATIQLHCQVKNQTWCFFCSYYRWM